MVRFASGEARYVDVLRLRTERLRIRSERAEALRTSQTGVRRLEETVAPDEAALSSLRTLLADSPAHITSALAVDLPAVPDPDSLIASMGALRYATQRVDLARGLAARDRAVRRFQLTGGLGIQRFAGDNGGFTVGPSLRASISLPLAVNRSNRAQQAAGDLRIALAETERIAFLAHLRTELLLARDRYAAAVERLQVYDGALLTGAREERQSALSAYRNGDLTLLELLDFERALSRAETERIRAAIDVTASYAEIFITLTAPSGLSADPAGSGDTND
jgi:cobalt-zinc-cadmium efflux system outer membrane protein